MRTIRINLEISDRHVWRQQISGDLVSVAEGPSASGASAVLAAVMSKAPAAQTRTMLVAVKAQRNRGRKTRAVFLT